MKHFLLVLLAVPALSWAQTASLKSLTDSINQLIRDHGRPYVKTVTCVYIPGKSEKKSGPDSLYLSSEAMIGNVRFILSDSSISITGQGSSYDYRTPFYNGMPGVRLYMYTDSFILTVSAAALSSMKLRGSAAISYPTFYMPYDTGIVTQRTLYPFPNLVLLTEQDAVSERNTRNGNSYTNEFFIAVQDDEHLKLLGEKIIRLISIFNSI
jgi:hypothetical protein